MPAHDGLACVLINLPKDGIKIKTTCDMPNPCAALDSIPFMDGGDLRVPRFAS